VSQNKDFSAAAFLLDEGLNMSNNFRLGDQAMSSTKVVSFFIHVHNETLSVVAGRVCNPDRSPIGINR
jgi:hypothetical protein